MVAGDGFEPPTFGLWAQRATGLLYPASLAGWGKRIRTSECQDQNLMPYHLAIPQKSNSSAFLYKSQACPNSGQIFKLP